MKRYLPFGLFVGLISLVSSCDMANGVTFRSSLKVAGTLEPSSGYVFIAAAQSGIVDLVNVDPGDKVKKGEPFFTFMSESQEESAEEINTTDLIAALNLQSEKDTLLQLKARYDSAHEEYEQIKKLKDTKAISQSEYILRKYTYEEAKAAYEQGLITYEVYKLQNPLQSNVDYTDDIQELLQKSHDQVEDDMSEDDDGEEYFDENAEEVPTEIDSGAEDDAESKNEVADEEEGEVVMTPVDGATAPFDGQVLRVNIHPGELTEIKDFRGDFDKAYIVFGQTDPLSVRVEIPEGQLDRFKPGARAYAYTPGRRRKKIPLEFAYIEPQLVKVGGMQVLIAVYTLKPGELALYPGQRIEVKIEVK